jgi:AraC family transcriptional regulator, transcriptional activator of pobA
MALKLTYKSPENGIISLFVRDLQIGAQTQIGIKEMLHTIAWNMGAPQTIWLDEVPILVPSNAIVPIMLNQHFRFERPNELVCWQFNKSFYCIVDHDKEVGCVGFLFFGPSPTVVIQLEDDQLERMRLLIEMFKEELSTDEESKADMLRMLLVRLIIKLTRFARKQLPQTTEIDDNKFDLVRQYSLFVERHFRTEHSVQFYADAMNKSAKTLSNVFSKLNKRTPQQIIHERIILEAKRLLFYTDKSSKEIAFELGFEDASHFSRFFKKMTLLSPTEIKKSKAS